jgi:hypothetical protein
LWFQIKLAVDDSLVGTAQKQTKGSMIMVVPQQLEGRGSMAQISLDVELPLSVKYTLLTSCRSALLVSM